MKPTVIHHWRWITPRHLLTCGAHNGLINRHHMEPVTCKNCLRVTKARGWNIDLYGKDKGRK